MTDDFDIDELLRAANPVNEHDLPAPGDSPHARAVYEKITGLDYTTGERTRRRRRWRYWRLYLGGIVALAGAGGGIGYAVTNSSHPTIQDGAVCYASDNINASRTLVAITGLGSVRDCAAAWEAGEIAGHRAGPPPPLQACVLPTGPAGVFPDRQGKGTVCRQLGLQAVLPPPPPVTTTTPGSPSTPAATVPLPPIVKATNTVVKAFATSCVGQTDALALVRRVLDADGLSSWKVKLAAPYTAARPCASPAVDEPIDTFYVTPVPPNPPATSTSAPSSTSTVPSVPPIVSVTNTVDHAFSTSCVDHNDASTIVRQALARYGLEWGILESPFTATDPCATATFDQANQLVRIIPAPRPGGQTGG